MNNKDLVNLIGKMGNTHKALLSEELIPDVELKHIYEDEDTLEIEIAPGVELVFCAENSCLEMITFCYEKASNPENPRFAGILPNPLDKLVTQNDVHIALGEPMFSKNQMELFATDLYGWDVYQLDKRLHTEALLDIQYNNKMLINNIHISLMDKNI
jgi:hypothetical protein